MKLWQDYDALCDILSDFQVNIIVPEYKGLGHLHLDGVNLQM